MSHAVLSASAGHRWVECPGSIALSRGKKDTAGKHAEWGTAAHELASWCLTGHKDAEAFEGRKIAVESNYYTVDREMIDCVQFYLDYVRQVVADTGGTLLVEQKVDYSAVLGVPDSFGTADAIILAGNEIIVIDLKTGKGEEVEAFENVQMRLYTLGALEDFGLVADFERARKVIVQPRLPGERVKEHDEPVDVIRAFGEHAAKQGRIATLCLDGAADPLQHLNPGEKQCRWCKAKATCPAVRREVLDTVSAADVNDFDDLTVPQELGTLDVEYLQRAWEKRDLIKGWLDAVLEKVTELAERGEFPGHKLVAGKRGARAWSDEEAAEAKLKGMRLKVDEMYNFKLISPTQAEKLLAENPRKWAKLTDLIVQSDGKPVVVPNSDKRPALVAKVEDDFTSLDANDLV